MICISKKIDQQQELHPMKALFISVTSAEQLYSSRNYATFGG